LPIEQFYGRKILLHMFGILICNRRILVAEMGTPLRCRLLYLLYRISANNFKANYELLLIPQPVRQSLVIQIAAFTLSHHNR